MHRGYVRQVRSKSAKAQTEALAAAGIDPIYTDRTPEDAIASLRKGDVLCIAGSLRILGDNRNVLREILLKIEDRGASVKDIVSGRVAQGPGAVMAIEALTEMAREKVRHLDHRGAALARWGTDRRTPKKRALKPWRDVVKYPKPEDALATKAMRGWSRSRAYADLGRRHPPYGPVDLNEDTE